MAQVYTNSCKEKGADVGVYVLQKMNAGQEQLLTEFLQEVNTQTYLVVLENLADMLDWDAVRTFLPDMEKGSRIIVSTQQFEIASLCIGHPCQPLELKQFSPDHSVCAFFKEVQKINNINYVLLGKQSSFKFVDLFSTFGCGHINLLYIPFIIAVCSL
jgi:hypothetical protein